MKIRMSLLAVALFGTSAIAQQPQASPFTTPAVRVYIYGGPKTHAEGQHDYPQFLADWSKILQNRGAHRRRRPALSRRRGADRRRRAGHLQG